MAKWEIVPYTEIEKGNEYTWRDLRMDGENVGQFDDAEIADEIARKLNAFDEMRAALKVAMGRMAHSNRNCLRLLPTEEWTIERGNRDDHCECEIAAVRAAIAKAEGK